MRRPCAGYAYLGGTGHAVECLHGTHSLLYGPTNKTGFRGQMTGQDEAFGVSRRWSVEYGGEHWGVRSGVGGRTPACSAGACVRRWHPASAETRRLDRAAAVNRRKNEAGYVDGPGGSGALTTVWPSALVGSGESAMEFGAQTPSRSHRAREHPASRPGNLPYRRTLSGANRCQARKCPSR